MRNHHVIVPWGRRNESLSGDEVAARCGLHPVIVERFVTLGIITPIADSGNRFAPEVILRIQRVLRLRHDLGLNYASMALVLELLDRIDELEMRLRQVTG